MRNLKPLLSLLPLVLVASCADRTFSPQRGSGQIRTETRVVSAPFSKVSLAGAFELHFTQGTTTSLTIEADENLLPRILSDVRGETLEFSERSPISSSKPIVIRLSHPRVSTFALSGAGNIDARQLSTPTLRVELAGAGNVSLEGTTNQFTVILSGSGNIKAGNLTANTAAVTLAGAGNIDLTTTNALTADLTGAGNITYSGNPNQVSQTIRGAGTIRPR